MLLYILLQGDHFNTEWAMWIHNIHNGETTEKILNKSSFQKQNDVFLTFTTLSYFCINHGDQRVELFQFEKNVLVSYRCFIWIPIRHGCWRLKSIPALKMLTDADIRWHFDKVEKFTQLIGNMNPLLT